MKKSKVFSVLIGIIILVVAVYLFMNNRGEVSINEDLNVVVEKWENIYEGNNIHFYYIDSSKPEIKNLKNKYEFDRMTNKAEDEISKTMILSGWLNSRSKPKVSAMDSKKTAEEIILQLETNEVISQKDYNSVLEEALATIGIISRSGELRGENVYGIIEIWSERYNKWVAIDGMNESYFTIDDVPLSAVELVECNISKVILPNGENKIKNKSKYFKELSKSIKAYTIKIDNSKYTDMKSNSNITYVKDIQFTQLETKEGYIQPTIFVNKSDVFELNPTVSYKNEETDTMPTLIFAKKNIKEDGDNYKKFSIGAFQNSIMIDEFYLSINDEPYIKVETYYDIALQGGNNVIKLSLDGKNAVRTVEIKKK